MNNSKSENRSPLKFFLLVFALSIPLWMIGTIIDVKVLPLDFPITDMLAAFIPTIAASILVYKEEGLIGVNKLIKRILDFPRITQKTWYGCAVLLPWLIYVVMYIIIYLLGLPLPINFHIPVLSIPFLFCLFFLGAVAEETGYMGYAIDPMQDRFGALSAGILIGIPWAVWHYPSIIQQGHNLTWIAWATLGTVAVRILIVWIYNNTGKSLFACILFHTFMNLGRPLFPRDGIHNPLVDYPEIHYSIIAIAASIVVFLWGAKTLDQYRYA
ncbi:MAG: CPBP family intramembrane metalloprotease [Pseudanabaena sp.]|nr:MAG: CPBP family intramembrane metalloprotease [Pseudanabaena sp.]